MKRALLSFALSLAACSSSAPAGTGTLTTGTASGAATGASGVSTSGGVGASSGASGTSTGGVGGTSGGASGTSGGASTGGAPLPCGTNAVWSGNRCLLTVCSGMAAIFEGCLLLDGGAGECIGTACNGANTLTDPQNCGYYGVVCPTGLLCVDGSCSENDAGLYVACDAGACPSGFGCDSQFYTACGSLDCAAAQPGARCEGPANVPGVCCDSTTCSTLNDSANCGACGNACPGGGGCYRGQCYADCATAAEGSECTPDGLSFGFCCGGACETSRTDGQNCSTCGAICPAGVACNGTECAASCLGASTPCPAGTACIPNNTCYPTDCSDAADGTICAATLTNGQLAAGRCCNQACVDEGTDSSNCGACGTVCGAGDVCHGSCQPPIDCATVGDGSGCTVTGGIPGTCCGGTCTDLSSDSLNCDTCYQACPTGATCQHNSCIGSGGGVQCPSTPCPAGYTCNMDFFVCQISECAGKGNGVPCILPDGGGIYDLCCDQVCSNLDDPQNCGQCGLACPEGAVCDSHTCSSFCSDSATCPAGTICSGRECVPRSCTELPNGAPCAFQSNAPGSCCNGACVMTDYVDSNNCAYCGDKCPTGSLCSQGRCISSVPSTNCDPACGAGEVCAAGVCVGSICAASAAQCAAQDGAVGSCCGSGICADVLTDPKNCGSCDFACPAGVGCQEGECQGAVCFAQQEGEYCSTDASHICCGTQCLDVSSDPNNCGFCGQVCQSGDTCQSGVCTS